MLSPVDQTQEVLMAIMHAEKTLHDLPSLTFHVTQFEVRYGYERIKSNPNSSQWLYSVIVGVSCRFFLVGGIMATLRMMNWCECEIDHAGTNAVPPLIELTGNDNSIAAN